MSNKLQPFHPLIQAWFAEELGAPTRAQELAWPVIAAGEHLLLTAPTGSGKTLAAFLWPLQQLASGAWGTGRTRVVYVSPLRALNNDIRRNLLTPLAALQRRFEAAGEPWPGIQVQTRSGDTPGSERQRMLRRPPEILVTTPESLNLLVSSAGGRRMLSGVAMVILDEIHAVVASKRGTHLITAVERLARLSGEFQRVALSATVRPLQAVAEFVGGYTLQRRGGGWRYQPRPVTVAQADDPRKLQVQVRWPDMSRPVPEGLEQKKVFWRRLADEIHPTIERNRSTLVFANNRRVTEKLTRFLNEGGPDEVAWAHHGSLSRELRLGVERRLKAGELAAIVATNSLELGIDVGALDEVVMVQTPPTVASTVQRLGRAGHQVGATSRGQLFPLGGKDLVEAAVVARAAIEGDLEPIQPIRAPLDVLAQVILAITGQQPWDLDELYAFLRCAAPYRRLSRRQYELVIQLLAGRYGQARLRELQPRVIVDGVENTIAARPGSLRLVYLSGGTIADRGYYALRHAETKARIGELDEEFVWERSLGDTFTLGSQTWRVHRITHNDVHVLPAGADVPPSIIPFWRADARNRSFHLSERIGRFLQRADARLEEPGFLRELQREHHLAPEATRELQGFLKRQQEHCGAPLPHRHHLLVEHFSDPLNSSGSKQVILHTTWGGAVNQPLALALTAAWRQRHDARLQVFHDNHGVLLILPDRFATADVLSLLDLGSLEELLRAHLGSTGLFGAWFRENAGRALLLPRTNIKRRQPLWLDRLRARKLLEQVSKHPDFPVVIETWRGLLQDEFDLPTLARLLEELRSGEIQVSECVTRSASPLCDGLTWRATNKFMYDDDAPEPTSGASLRRDLLREIVHTPGLRPQVPMAVVERLQGRLQRTAPGYAPAAATELVEQVKDRLLVPAAEWRALLAAMERDEELEPEEILGEASARLCWLITGRDQRAVCALERLPLLLMALQIEPDPESLRALADPSRPVDDALLEIISRLLERASAAEDRLPPDQSLALVLGQWLQLHGPVHADELTVVLGISAAALAQALDPLLRTGDLVSGPLVRDHPQELLCDAENLEILLRMARAAARPSLDPLPVDALPLFLAQHQGLAPAGHDMKHLQAGLEQLFGYPARARAWEEWILPARLNPYQGAWLEGLMQDSDLLWFGCGRERASFCFPEDLDLYREAPGESEGPLEELLASRGSFTFEDARQTAGLGSAALTEALWASVWRGDLSNSTLAVLRKGIEQGFEAAAVSPRARRGGRAAFGRWKASRPFQGHWEVLRRAPEPADALERMDDDKQRVRQLLERYGVIFRQLLAREAPALRWRPLFRALRLMELSGELASGLFFHGVPGPQFASHEAVRALRQDLPTDVIWWHNAADPASCCGLGLEAMKGQLPARRRTSWLAWRGRELALVARANGQRVEIHLPPDHADLLACLQPFKVLLDRRFRPLKRVEVDQVNGLPAMDSPYAEPLQRFGFRREFKSLVLRPRF